jgi:hypothetical protein
MTETVTFEFRSLQPVTVTELKARGFVYSRLANAEGQNEYKVRYWMDGKRAEEWFFAFELEDA